MYHQENGYIKNLDNFLHIDKLGRNYKCDLKDNSTQNKLPIFKNSSPTQSQISLKIANIELNRNNSNKYLNSQFSLKYKPRRLVKIGGRGGEIPLHKLGKSIIDCQKSYNFSGGASDDTRKDSLSKKKKLFVESSSLKDCNFGPSNNNGEVEFRNAYIIKFAKNANQFLKLQQNGYLLSTNMQKTYEEETHKISKLLESHTQLLFDDIDNDILKSPEVSQSLTTNADCFGINQNNKKNIIISYEYNYSIIKLLNLIFNELKEVKEENMKLLKKSYDQEIRLNSKSKELDEIQKFLNKYEINAKIAFKNAKEQTIQKLKKSFNQKENGYLINIYKLEEEIRNLTFLLDKNKGFYMKYKDTEKLIDESKKQSEEMKFAYNKELQNKNVQLGIEKDKEEELLRSLEELESTIENYKAEKEQKKREEIEIMAQTKKLEMIINEKNENILMLNEELEEYIREFYKEKYLHKNTLSALQTLETRLFKEKENEGDIKLNNEGEYKKENIFEKINFSFSINKSK